MTTHNTSDSSLTKVKNKDSLSKIHRVYYMLAAFDILTILGSLLLMHQMVSIYEKSVVTGEQWTQRSSSILSALSRATEMNAPGNNVFQSRDIDKERRKFDASYQDFTIEIDYISNFLKDLHNKQNDRRRDVVKNTDEKIHDIEKDIDAARLSGILLKKQAYKIFATFEVNKYEATKYMAIMDQNFSRILNSLSKALNKVMELQKHHFITQILVVKRLQEFKYIIVVAVMLIVFAIAMYGRYLAIEVEKNTVSREYVEDIFVSITNMLIVVDDKAQIEKVNDETLHILGYKKREMLGQSLNMVMAKEKHYESVEGLIERESAKNSEKIYVTKDGQEISVLFSAKLLNHDSRDKLGAVCVAQDITDRKEAESELHIAKANAESANNAKSLFLATMSHELRTPLNSILGLTRMIIEDQDISENNREMGSTVYKSANNLLEIVNDILDISKIESESIALEEIGFDFKNIVVDVIEVTAPMASAKSTSIKYHYDNNHYLIGDPLRINSILRNLISNAIKYTSDGNVDIDIKGKTLKKDCIEIYCEVKDDGIGIPEDRLHHIFEKFTQADLSTTRKYGGTGLGLSITKELVEMMGGTIGVESKLGEGSVFWFKIPFNITDELDKDSPLSKSKNKKIEAIHAYLTLEKAKLLVAEDHLLNQDFISRLLRHMGFKYFDIVDNGVLAIEAFKSKDYDLILMDCHMPEKNGYETTVEIRKMEVDKNIPIVALTADAMKGTREKCLKYGMTDYLSKPINADELKNILAQWVIFPEENNGISQTERQAAKEAPVDMDLLEEYADTPEDIKNFIEIFFEQSEESLGIMENNCVDGENKDWMEASHKLKGGAGMFGAKKLRELCAQAEEMQNASAGERKKILDLIQKEDSTIKEYLHNITSS